MKQISITPQFVEFIPTQLDDGVLYISQEYKTTIHKCCCGCGQEVVTPLSPAQWQIRVFKDKVTLLPSIGNWNSKCKSHYWIKENRVFWAGALTNHEIRLVQERDHRDLQKLTEYTNQQKNLKLDTRQITQVSVNKEGLSVLDRLWNWISSKWL